MAKNGENQDPNLRLFSSLPMIIVGGVSILVDVVVVIF